MNNKFICAEEVAQELSVSKPYAYKLIKQVKMQDQMKCVCLMNNLKDCAEEIVLKERVYM